MKIGIAADHGGFELKNFIRILLEKEEHNVTDFGAHELVSSDDYPDFVIPMARDVAKGIIQKGIAICGSGVGACIAANKIKGARACLILDPFSARQGVEDDDMNILCIGGRVIGQELAWELIKIFLTAQFKDEERFRRRLQKIIVIEKEASI
jgi:ribose 5-phosphate isomerase B